MNLYNHKDWVRFREEVIKLDDYKCSRCFRSRSDEIVLQVHHKAYLRGRNPWEYSHSECETLCKGCHAREHGIIMPQSGWEHMGSDDLGGLDGNCELCGTKLRYIYLIYHPRWSLMAVGTDCCDRLTTTTQASEFLDQSRRANGKLKRFVSSTRWEKSGSDRYLITQKNISVCIWWDGNKFRIKMDGALGKTEHETLIDAKIKVFKSIESRQAKEFLEKRRRKIIEQKLQKQKEALKSSFSGFATVR